MIKLAIVYGNITQDVVQNVTQVKIRIKVACKLSVGTNFDDLEQLTYTLQCISYFSETAV